MGTSRNRNSRLNPTTYVNHSSKRRSSRPSYDHHSQLTLLTDLPPELRGPPQNRWGGYKTIRLKPLPGSTFGKANDGRVYSEEERQQWEKQFLETDSKTRRVAGQQAANVFAPHNKRRSSGFGNH